MSDVYAFIAAEEAVHPVTLLCRVLGVARSSFYAWREAEGKRRARERADNALAPEIAVIHRASKGAYGVPRVRAELRRLDRAVNRKRAERITRDHRITGVTRRRRHSPARPDRQARPTPDLIGRGSTTTRPGPRLVVDIAYLPAGEGRLDLACRLDPATREVVGYAMADHHRAEPVVDALRMAHGRGGPEPGCIAHSDRGSAYTSTRFRSAISRSGLRQSTGRTGSRFGNAAAESFWP
ncbi:IS3 family transposase [Streptomyces incanus]